MINTVFEASPYFSPPAVIVGEFDANRIQAEVDGLFGGQPGDAHTQRAQLLPNEVTSHALESVKLTSSSLSVPSIEEARGQYYLPITQIVGGNSSVFSWHFDFMSDGWCQPIQFVLGATLYPSDVVTGRLDVPALPDYDDNSYAYALHKYITSAEGQNAVDQAIENGDLEKIESKPGDLVLIPEGAIHRRPHILHAKPRATIKWRHQG